MSAVVADTHAVVWLLFSPHRLSPDAMAALQGAIDSGDPIYVASISLIEVAYLVEKGRLPREVFDRLVGELLQPGSGLTIVPLDMPTALAVESIPRSDVPEMPDRVIAATAAYLGVPLVTRDLRIRSAAISTIW
jgi:PIN domain nuclease of toxin-antitoxin system